MPCVMGTGWWGGHRGFWRNRGYEDVEEATLLQKEEPVQTSLRGKKALRMGVGSIWVSGGGSWDGVTEALEGEEVWGNRQDRHQPMTWASPGPPGLYSCGRQLSCFGCTYRMGPITFTVFHTSALQ